MLLHSLVKHSIRLSRNSSIKHQTSTRPAALARRCHSSLSVVPADTAEGNQHDGDTSISATSKNHDDEWTNQRHSQIPNFHDSKAAFESKTTLELVRAAVCFGICRIPYLVRHAEEYLNLSQRLLGTTLTNQILKETLYGHFCAGEDQTRIRPVLRKLESVGVGSILDYAAESSDDHPHDSNKKNQNKKGENPSSLHSSQTNPGENGVTTSRSGLLRPLGGDEYSQEDEDQYDRHVKVFQTCIQDAASLSYHQDTPSFAAIKVTALGNPKLLSRMSKAIVESKKLFQKFDSDLDGYVSRDEFEAAYKKMFFNQDDRSMSDIFDEYFEWDTSSTTNGGSKIDYISWSMKLKPADLPKFTKSCKEMGPLAMATPTDEEIELMEVMYARGRSLAETAKATGTRLLIDAEQTRFQPAIDNLVLDLQQSFNATDTSNKPIIFNTYQCYLKDAPERLRTDVNRAKRFNYHFGAKLVRGAYLESERQLAEIARVPSPIHETIQQTHASYNDSVDYLLEESVKSDQLIEVMCATHNQQSIEKAIAAMDKYCIERSKNTVYFGQLYGMSDHLSFNLGQSGYRAYKYVPYGEVQEVIPYLLRRARENSSISGGAAAEFDMIKEELKRRLSPFRSQISV